MARLSMSLFGAVVAVVALAVPAQGAVAPRTPPQDLVIGGGNAGFIQDISIDARSDALGGNASGTVSFRVPLVGLAVSGPVTCLAVDGTQAVIGFTDTSGILGAATVVIVDRGPFSELRRDLFTLDPFGPVDCSPRDLAAATSIRVTSWSATHHPKTNAETAAGATTRTRPDSRLEIKASASPSR